MDELPVKERPIWLDSDQKTVKVIDQRLLPHQVVVLNLLSVKDIIFAIQEMVVRGHNGDVRSGGAFDRRNRCLRGHVSRR